MNTTETTYTVRRDGNNFIVAAPCGCAEGFTGDSNPDRSGDASWPLVDCQSSIPRDNCVYNHAEAHQAVREMRGW